MLILVRIFSVVRKQRLMSSQFIRTAFFILAVSMFRTLKLVYYSTVSFISVTRQSFLGTVFV